MAVPLCIYQFQTLSEEKYILSKISEIANFNIGPNLSDTHSIEVCLVSIRFYERVGRSLVAAIINENVSSVLGLLADDMWLFCFRWSNINQYQNSASKDFDGCC